MIQLGAVRTDQSDPASDTLPRLVGSAPPAAVMRPRRRAPGRSSIEESFRTLRSNLLLRTTANIRTFIVTSATPQEGKSTISANLACSLAAAGKQVLLVDADLRRPSVHRIFRVPNVYGLVNVLGGTRTFDDACYVTPAGPVLLPSGPSPVDPQALLESERFAQLLRKAKAQFDIVLVDSAPVLSVADTPLIVPQIDAAIFVMRFGAVTERDAALAVERVRAAGGTVIGGVLSHVADDDESYHVYESDYVTAPRQTAGSIRNPVR